MTRRELLQLVGMATVGASAVNSGGAQTNPRLATVVPRPYSRALRNPLMGFRKDLESPAKLAGYEWVTLARHYIKWNEIENDESDGVDKIRAFCDAKWQGLDAVNVKVIPRVYLHWSQDDQKYWPADIATGDYESPKFKARLQRLIERLGEVWNNDARVAFIQMGLIGKWGEHHSPDVSPEMQKLMGDAFTRAFPNKKVAVRHGWDFKDYTFGIYWDSWAHIQQTNHAEGILKLGKRWQTQPIGGETAYDWGRFREQPGDNPNDTLSDPVHRKYLIDSIRQLHCSSLGWVANYDADNVAANAGAEEVQRAFGYRFEITEAQFPTRLNAEQRFPIRVSLRNTGSSPLYADWPLQLSLLDETTRKPVWQSTFNRAKTSTWLPGDDWDAQAGRYRIAAQVYQLRGEFQIPRTLPRAKYFLALSILDPAGNVPAVQLATANYFRGGLHPLGRVGVGIGADDVNLQNVKFDDSNDDRRLRYFAASKPKSLL